MIISFDIWDTILKRKCHPEEIKLYTAQYIALKYNDILKEEYKDIYKILIKRDEIEAKICKETKEKGHNEECKILDVFSALQNEIFIKKIEDISDELLKVELEQEKRAIYINPMIIPIFEKYKDLDMYCISDMYFSGDNLKELLDYVKIPVNIKKVYSSADYLLNKRTGDLYKKVEEELNITPDEHIHVGDNQYSDIEVAEKIGIKTIKIEKEDISFSPRRGREFLFKLNNTQKATNNKEDKIFNEGLNLAPILYFFVYDIIEYAIKNKIKKIYYLTREGETFIKIHEIIEKNNPFGVEIPECDILEVSRMATFSASLKEFSISELLRLWSQYRVQSMKALFTTLAIDVEPYKEYIKKYDIELCEDIVEPWFDVRVQKLCADEEFTTKINSELLQKRNELLKYFEQDKGITNNDEPLFVVDIGWRGTIQDNLAYVFNNKQIDGYYLTLYDFYNLQPVNTNKNSFISDKNIRDNEVSNIITLLEWIYNPGTGSVIEYKNGKAIRKAKKEELEVVNKYIKPLQVGMLEGSKIINEYMKYHQYEMDEIKEYVYKLIKNIKLNPSKELVEAYYSMVFNDTFGTSEYVEKDNKLSTMEKINIFKCRNILRKEPWKEAFISYNNMGYLNSVLKFKSFLRKIIGRK